MPCIKGFKKAVSPFLAFFQIALFLDVLSIF